MWRIEQLESGRLLLDEAVRRLEVRARRTSAGVLSLSHVMVVAPTRGAGRHIREALARRLGAVAAPVVKTPSQLLGKERGADGALRAKAEEVMRLSALAETLLAAGPDEFPHLLPARKARAMSMQQAVDTASTLSRIWRILAEGPYLMRDVARRAAEIIKGDNLDFEVRRWQELAHLEERYLAVLHARSLTLPAEDTLAVIENGPDLPGVEEIVLPGFVAPPPALVRVLSASGLPVTAFVHAPSGEEDAFDAFGRLVADTHLAELSLPDAAIFAYPTPGSEAAAAAAHFASVPETDALPAVVLAQPEFFPELEGSFSSMGVTLHNPARSLVASSSLGRLAAQILALLAERRFDVLSSFIRQGDVQRYLSAKLSLDHDGMAQLLVELDDIRSSHLPETAEDVLRHASPSLSAAIELLDFGKRFAALDAGSHTFSCAESLRSALAELFSCRSLDETRPEDREFAAAAAALAALFDSFADMNLPPAQERLLFAKALETASYSLEPDRDGAIATDGWLELPFLPQHELVILGMQEGVVPESVVGHAFVPDSLREALGLTTNAVRARRDAFMLREAVLSRPQGFVRISFHAQASDRTALKPSRLLLRTTDDAVFAARARRLYADIAAPAPERHRTLPPKWRLALPIPGSAADAPPGTRPLDRISPSDIDCYLRCPFTYFLRTRFGVGVDDAAEELDSAHFGSLCHDVLDAWARGDTAASDDESEIAASLSRHLDELAQKRFGADAPALVQLQIESARTRLAAFARRQAQRRRDGWLIRFSERPMRVVYDGVQIRGRADRIDFNPSTREWCVIDYKTWKNLDRASPFDSSSRSVEFARSRTLPLATKMHRGRPREFAWRSLQLPLYCAMLEAAGVQERISACYCVLGETEEQTAFSEAVCAKDWAPDSDRLVREILRRISLGVFWPPSPNDEWHYDYAGLIFDSPQQSIDPAWIEDQLARASAL